MYERNKGRLRLDECGTFAGLVSKILAEYSARMLALMSGENQRGINESLVAELLETTFLLDEALTATGISTTSGVSSTLTSSNQDNLWHIIGLLTLSPAQLIADRDALLRARSKACDLIIKLFFGQHNPTAIRSLTRSPAWQDVICQLFCVERTSTTTNTGVPPVILTIPDDNDARKLSANEDDDVWENIEYNSNKSEQFLFFFFFQIDKLENVILFYL